ncbi:hypothetical protein L1765_00575 [Microaerobacter geothermalis]|uniref:hypothetical protein n=1 Tax=Microaerobacter geothermalis TaxID=674972 RepID=UPI001F33AC19|nr:hypothetical protein [Microaerobacter geothermalis]MCF6092486.1 hypothetical protein [Microaerobacter geothermalis]
MELLPEDLVRDHLIFHLLVKVLDRDFHVLKRSAVKFPIVYLHLADSLREQLIHKIRSTREQMRKVQLRILQEEKNKDGYTILYKHKGYIHQANYSSEFLRSLCEETFMNLLHLSYKEDLV